MAMQDAVPKPWTNRKGVLSILCRDQHVRVDQVVVITIHGRLKPSLRAYVWKVPPFSPVRS